MFLIVPESTIRTTLNHNGLDDRASRTKNSSRHKCPFGFCKIASVQARILLEQYLWINEAKLSFGFKY